MGDGRMKNKINVNISPNPLDLQTLHCSQNDTGERKFYFTLHNNGEVIDTTDISDPIFEPFDVYKGGTEQLLPVNTDDPTTSPIIADIQYPDEEKTEQELTYRESPTTIDGKAKLKSIKGNTIVWNQLLDKSQYPSTQTVNGITWTNNGDGSFTANGTAGSNSTCLLSNNAVGFILNHKYLTLTGFVEDGSSSTYEFMIVRFKSGGSNINLNCYKDMIGIYNFTGSSAPPTIQLVVRSGYTATNLVFRPQIFDLTKMFGATKADEIYAMETAQVGSGVDYFKSLFPLPYYKYDAGSLLSFNGTGIKTVGFNQWDEEWELGVYNTSTGLPALSTSSIRCKNAISIIPSCNYCFTRPVNNGAFNILWYDANDNFILYETMGSSTVYRVTTPPSNAGYVRFYMGSGYGTTYKDDICINISDTSRNGTYESYTTSTTTIPTDTYFPTGMKSAGTVYDEFTSSRAYTRIGEVDLGSLTWTVNTTYTNIFQANLTGCKQGVANQKANILCANYETVISGANSVIATQPDKTIRVRANSTVICILDSTYSTAEALTTALDGVMLQYELAEEEVTEFTHASLICEDGESALYHDDDLLVCDCTEDFSKDSGFKDCKIKFSKGDGVVYSNKIQLHIERKP